MVRALSPCQASPCSCHQARNAVHSEGNDAMKLPTKSNTTRYATGKSISACLDDQPFSREATVAEQAHLLGMAWRRSTFQVRWQTRPSSRFRDGRPRRAGIVTQEAITLGALSSAAQRSLTLVSDLTRML